MVIADPTAELVNLVRAMPDPAPAEAPSAAKQQALLVRRRFGLALPTPFVGPPTADEPIRVATAADGAAIASVKWRVFGTNYRGLIADSFIDDRDVVPPASFWVGRAMVPPTRRHRLFVWGRPGTVHGYVDCGPAHADDVAADRSSVRPSDRDGRSSGDRAALGAGSDHERDDETVGEVWELYVDPAAQGRGGGARLLDAAEAWLDGVGLHEMVLSVLGTNTASQAFYRSRGWAPTGRVVPVDLGVVRFEEHRYRRGAITS